MNSGKSEWRYADVSGYCACQRCCGTNASSITASGNIVQVGVCAAPRCYPFGTIISIPGIGVCNVQDRGGAIKTAGSRVNKKTLKYDRIDVYFRTHKEALQWGRRTLRVKVIKK